METDCGSILRLSPLGEHGLIVTWSTAGHGLLRTAARDARKPGSEMAGRIDLFHECELLFAPATRGDLHALRQVSLLNPRLELRRSLSKLRLASYMARLMDATLEGEDRDPEWHRLISGALDYLCRVDASAAILRHFEKRLAGLHGLCGPTLTPYQALLRHCRHLPAGRDELLRDLNAT